MIGNRERIGLAGLIFLHFLQTGTLYKDSANQIISFIKFFKDKTPNTLDEVKAVYTTITDSTAKEVAKELLRVLIVNDPQDLLKFNFISGSVFNLYTLLTKYVIQQKTSGKEISGTDLSFPGDIVSFLKILFLSLFDDDLYRELEVFIQAIRPSYSTKNTIDVVRKVINDRRMKPVILNLLLPDESTISSTVTLDLDKKIQMIQQVLNTIPPL